MATSYMKLPYDDKVLRPDALRARALATGTVGFTLDVGLNYYRGMPLSAVETLTLTIDGEQIPDHLILIELNGKLFPPSQIPAAFTEFWSVKKNLRIHVYNGGIAAGEHQVDLNLIVRVVYMQFAPGIWGQFDGSASRVLTLQEAE